MPKINQLTGASSLANTDIMIADTASGTSTRKIAYQDLRTQLQNESKSVFALKGETATDAQVADAVGDWLDEHVTPSGSAVVIDDTLKIPGAAADSKAAGETITALSDNVTGLKNAVAQDTVLSDAYWQRKGLASASGTASNSTTRISTIDYIPKDFCFVYPKSGYMIAVFAWDNTDTYQGVWDGNGWVNTGITWFSNEIALKGLPGNYNHRILARSASGTSVTITLAECSNIVLQKTTDDTLSMSGISADAKKTGNELTEIKNTVGNIGSEIRSIVNAEKYIPIPFEIRDIGYAISYSSGELQAGSSYATTGFVDIGDFFNIRYKRNKSTLSTTQYGIAFYNRDKVYIGGIACKTSADTLGYEENLYITPAPIGTKYARFTILADANTYGNFELYGLNTEWVNNNNPKVVPIEETKADIIRIAPNDGTTRASSGTSLLSGAYKVSDINAVEISGAYKVAIFFYDIDSNYIGILKRGYVIDLTHSSVTITEDSWFYQYVDLSNIDKRYNFILMVQRNDSENILVSEINNISLRYTSNDSIEEKINRIGESLVEETSLEDDSWVRGVFSTETGSRTSTTSEVYICNGDFITTDNVWSVGASDGYQYLICAYSNASANSYIGYYTNGAFTKSLIRLAGNAWLTEETNVCELNDNYYYRFCLRKADGSNIALTDADNFYIKKFMFGIKPLIASPVTLIPNKVFSLIATALITNTNYSTIEFYEVDNKFKYFVNQRCFVSQFRSNSYDSLITRDCCRACSIINLDSETKYVVISASKESIDSFCFHKVETTQDKVLACETERINEAHLSYGVLNSIASANQFANIEYTPIRRLPYCPGIGKKSFIPAGTPCKGIPYSSTGVVSKFVGQTVSFYTFLTAIKNPRSVLYTRRIAFRPTGSTYYAGTCFNITGYAFGSHMGYFDNTYSHIDIDKDYEFVSPYDMQDGDLLWSGSHVAMVVRVFRDDHGRILNYMAVQSHPPFPGSNTHKFVVDDNGYLSYQNYHDVEVCRPNKRRDRRTGRIDYGTYEIVPWVKGYDDEILEELIYPDIMPEYGDKACVEAGTDVIVNIIDGTGYSYIEIYKDDVLVETKNTIEDFTMSNISYGKYRFKMIGGSKTSESSLIAADVQGSYNNNTKIVTFSSANATPVYAAAYADSTSYAQKHGVMHYVKRFTVNESNNGSANVSDIVNNRFPHVIVGFLTEYGVATWLSRPFDDAWEYVDDNTPDVDGDSTDTDVD